MEHLNKKIIHYNLTRFIGEGGMASVYEGIHEKLGTKVAVKILNPILTANAQIRVRFENEAKFMASLNHPNITKVIDYEDQPGTLAIVMELLEGQDLSTLIKTKGALSPKELLPIFTQILDAFQYAHEKGIVHRDIKPSNIYIDANNNIKILDFGIAKIFGSGDDLTSTGMQMGTPVYMSPEQVKTDKNIDYRSDIFSLGVTLFFALNGKPPYDSETQSNFEIFNKVVYEPIPDLKNYPELNKVIKIAVAKDPNNRFHDANEFKKILIDCIAGNSATQTQNSNSEKTLIDTTQNTVKTEKPIIEAKPKVEEKPIQKTPKVEKDKSDKKVLVYILSAVAVIVIGFLAFKFLAPNADDIAKQQALQMQQDSIRKADSLAIVAKQFQIDSLKNVEIAKKRYDDSIAMSGNKELLAKDETAWTTAKRKASIASYEKYLSDFPQGKYTTEAETAIKLQKTLAEKAQSEKVTAVAKYPESSMYGSWVTKVDEPDGKYTIEAEWKSNNKVDVKFIYDNGSVYTTTSTWKYNDPDYSEVYEDGSKGKAKINWINKNRFTLAIVENQDTKNYKDIVRVWDRKK